VSLIEVADLRTEFNLTTTQVSDESLEFCISNASRTLLAWVGAETYDDANAEDPKDSDRASALAAAESYLSMYHALLISGARIRANGVVKSEQDAAGPMGGTIINQYTTPGDLIALRQQFYQQAEALAEIYLQVAGSGTGAATVTMQGGWRKCTTLGEQV
jgi:hypothetical protein